MNARRRAPRPGAALEADFPGWRVWRSSEGRWWAVRTGRRAQYGRDAVPMTVDADDEDGLRLILQSHDLAEAC